MRNRSGRRGPATTGSHSSSPFRYYACYVFGAALNAFFPLYVLLLVPAIVTFILTLSRLDVALAARSFTRSTPCTRDRHLPHVHRCRTGIGVDGDLPYTCSPACPHQSTRRCSRLWRRWTCRLMVPALTAGGILLWKRMPWGYMIASVASIQGGMCSCRHLPGSGVKSRQGQPLIRRRSRTQRRNFASICGIFPFP